MKPHAYEVQVNWTGNTGTGTSTYRSYERSHTIHCPGKPPLDGSSDPSFRGDPARYSPEDLLVASLSSCHMLWYLHLCSVNQVNVVDYQDDASGLMEETESGAGAFVSVTLRPKVTVTASSDQTKAASLHEDAHRYCFIANSVKFPVKIEPQIAKAGEVGASDS